MVAVGGQCVSSTSMLARLLPQSGASSAETHTILLPSTAQSWKTITQLSFAKARSGCSQPEDSPARISAAYNNCRNQTNEGTTKADARLFTSRENVLYRTSPLPERHSASSVRPLPPGPRPHDAPNDSPLPQAPSPGYSRAVTEGASSAAPPRSATFSAFAPAADNDGGQVDTAHA